MLFCKNSPNFVKIFNLQSTVEVWQYSYTIAKLYQKITQIENHTIHTKFSHFQLNLLINLTKNNAPYFSRLSFKIPWKSRWNFLEILFHESFDIIRSTIESIFHAISFKKVSSITGGAQSSTDRVSRLVKWTDLH